MWTPIAAVEGNFPVSVELQPYHAILIRGVDKDMYNTTYFYSNGTTTVNPINFILHGSLYNAAFISQQILYSDGTKFSVDVNFTAKDITRSFGEENRNGPVVSNWLLKFRAKFE